MEQVKINIYNAVGNSFCTEADDGQLVYALIQKVFDENKLVVLDFHNVEMVTSAFLNSAVGQLYGKYDQEYNGWQNSDHFLV
ncbi:MAG TPA: STAS-like domain-containing protein [Aquella sp.]|nr:STAS-like domain-containing protein [Aquella sp.]